jgi:hypothetical protein
MSDRNFATPNKGPLKAPDSDDDDSGKKKPTPRIVTSPLAKFKPVEKPQVEEQVKGDHYVMVYHVSPDVVDEISQKAGFVGIHGMAAVAYSSDAKDFNFTKGIYQKSKYPSVIPTTLCVPHSFDAHKNGILERGAQGYARHAVVWSFDENPGAMSTAETCHEVIQSFLDACVEAGIYTLNNVPEYNKEIHFKVVNNWLQIINFKGFENLWTYDKPLRNKYASVKDLIKISKNNLYSVFPIGKFLFRSIVILFQIIN